MNTPIIAYATLSGSVDHDMVRRVAHAFSGMPRATHCHIGFHSGGGDPGDAIFIFNFLKSTGSRIFMYNMGNVYSAALTVYLAGDERIALSNSVFLAHRVTATLPPRQTPESLVVASQSANLDTARTEGILRKETSLSTDEWAIYANRDLFIPAVRAAEIGLAKLGEFLPPTGTQIIQI